MLKNTPYTKEAKIAKNRQKKQYTHTRLNNLEGIKHQNNKCAWPSAKDTVAYNLMYRENKRLKKTPN